ncbi:MAG: Gfo/Idh/MocA family oxidoreductase [Chloroflexota bacterium]|nr:Gfo/Idh/MocA family oxidoreductase [Chloroflexota bacterium]
MTDTLRIAVVGAGSIARRYHLPSLARLSEEGKVELVALCDIEKQRAQAMAARFGFQHVYQDYRALPELEAPEAVWALVPIAAMHEVAGFFLSQGIPTLMEKPPGGNSRETRELLEIAKKEDTPHQVAFNRRHAPLLRRMKALLEEAEEPVQFLSCQFYRVNRREQDFAYGTGLHGLDTLHWLGGSEICAVHTKHLSRGGALITLAYANGTQGIMEMLPRAGMQSERYTAHAGERTVVVDGVVEWLTSFPGYLRCFDGGETSLHIKNADSPTSPEIVGGFYGESAHFVRCLREGLTPSPGLEEALRSVRIAEAVNAEENVLLS